MMDWTDRHCRYFLRGFSPHALLYTEMITAAAILRGDRARLLDFDPEEHPVALQLGGSDPKELAAAARAGEDAGYDEINLNCGCPSDRVASGSFGACLMLKPDRVAECVAALSASVSVPVTVKMRLGWDSSTINAPELARALEDAGAAAVTVHGRTRCQKYEGTADWAQIARVKEAVGIPVFGSGDVEDVETLAGRIESGMVDGVVIARGMLGNFWFVRQAVHRLATGRLLPDLDFACRIALARRHLDMLCAYHGDARAMRIGRKYVAWTIRGCAGAARLRAEVQTMDTRERLDALLDRALASGPRPEGWFQPVFVSGEG